MNEPREYSLTEDQAPEELPVQGGRAFAHACPACKAERTFAADRVLAERGWMERTQLCVCGSCGSKYTHRG